MAASTPGAKQEVLGRIDLNLVPGFSGCPLILNQQPGGGQRALFLWSRSSEQLLLGRFPTAGAKSGFHRSRLVLNGGLAYVMHRRLFEFGCFFEQGLRSSSRQTSVRCWTA